MRNILVDQVFEVRKREDILIEIMKTVAGRTELMTKTDTLEGKNIYVEAASPGEERGRQVIMKERTKEEQPQYKSKQK